MEGGRVDPLRNGYIDVNAYENLAISALHILETDNTNRFLSIIY
jgi:hypothetical protein